MLAHVLSKYRWRCYVKGCVKSGSLSLHKLEYLLNAGTMCMSGDTHLQCYSLNTLSTQYERCELFVTGAGD